jgi:hypothetical protein
MFAVKESKLYDSREAGLVKISQQLRSRGIAGYSSISVLNFLGKSLCWDIWNSGDKIILLKFCIYHMCVIKTLNFCY